VTLPMLNESRGPVRAALAAFAFAFALSGWFSRKIPGQNRCRILPGDNHASGDRRSECPCVLVVPNGRRLATSVVLLLHSVDATLEETCRGCGGSSAVKTCAAAAAAAALRSCLPGKGAASPHRHHPHPRLEADD
jgi:hypothetical protein